MQRLIKTFLIVAPLAVCIGLSAAPTFASTEPDPPSAKPLVPAEDYGKWESLRSVTLSPTGNAVAYLSHRVDGTRELRVHRLEPETNWNIPWGEAPVFSENGRFLVWTVTPSKEEREQLEEQGKPVKNRGEVLEIATGERRELGETSALALDPTGDFLAVRGISEDGISEDGAETSDLHVHDLRHGSATVFGNVASLAWHDKLPLLAMTLTGGGERGHAVQVYAPAPGRLLSLDHAASEHLGLVWAEEVASLAVLRARVNADDEGEQEDEIGGGNEDGADDEDGDPTKVDTTEHALLTWASLDATDTPSVAPARILDPTAAGLGSEIYLTADTEISWSPDGRRLAFGVRPREASQEEDKGGEDGEDGEGDEGDEGAEDGEGEDAEGEDGEGEDGEGEEDELPGVQIWHTSDVRLQPHQKSDRERDRKRALLTVWDLDTDRVVRVGTELEHDTEVLTSWTHALETDHSPYAWGNMFGRPFRDLWSVDLASGERRKSLEKVRYAWPSAEGRYLIWYDGADVLTLELATGTRANLSAGLETSFVDTDDDHPNDGQFPPFGIGGWTTGDIEVLLYDRFDVWRVAADGSAATRLTRGAEDETVYRLEDLDPDEESFDLEAGLYFSLRNEWTEQRGYARWTSCETRPCPSARRLVLEDRGFVELSLAKSAEVLAFRRESRAEAPEVLVAGKDLEAPRRVAGSNPFLAEHAWTRAELVEYHNPEGRKLHGILLHPAHRDPSRKAPMIVYAYEILSPSLHRWQPPSELHPYNTAVWTQHGYYVFLPDIHFRGGDPGVSLAETLDAALDAVDATGWVDRSRVGFVGHSWGGYHATYLAARTELFAAAVAGAPLTDFVSFMGQIHWNPGLAETDHWETGQARMAVPYWEDPEGHHRNSPLHGVHEMTTPLLMAHGDKDSVVEFFQATLFYNFARRAGKEMVLLVYEGADHGLRKEENQIDYHRRILEWFGHHLKGEPAPEWITEGTRWLDHPAEKRRVATGESSTP